MKDKTMIARHILGKSSQPRSRLQFPQITQQRKHFQPKHEDQIRFGTQQYENLTYAKHNKLDISDIEGAKPKLHYLERSQKRVRTLQAQARNIEGQDQLENLAKSSFYNRNHSHSLKQLNRSKQRIKINGYDQQTIGQGIRHTQTNKTKPMFQHLKTESTTNVNYQNLDKYRILDHEIQEGRPVHKRSILQNPTYISSLFL